MLGELHDPGRGVSSRAPLLSPRSARSVWRMKLTYFGINFGACADPGSAARVGRAAAREYIGVLVKG